tara:strand:+ start:1413 stop:3860 length:2448 start_codon:yes stop_codon:yes gene_type:complete
MINKPKFNSGSGFPNQFAPDEEKASLEYGLRVGRAIESEWFSRDYGSSLYGEIRSEFLTRRLYARGEQPVEKYKNELSINGDLSYLNLDWTPVPIIPKFVDIVVNGISNRLYDIKAEAVDQFSTIERDNFRNELRADMIAYEPLKIIKDNTGVNAFNFDEAVVPKSDEELDLYMNLRYKQGVEVAQETALKTLLEINDYEETKRRIDEDNVVLGISVLKHNFDMHDGVKVDYVDPVNFVYSPTEDPNFRDCYYFGEVKSVHASELKKINPYLEQEELEQIVKTASRYDGYRSTQNLTSQSGLDKSSVSLLYFSYKTDSEIVYKIKDGNNGGKKAIKKDGSFNPPKTEQARFKKVSRRIDVWYEGVMVLGTNTILKWEVMKNMVRPKSSFQKTIAPYIVNAIKMSKGKIDSLVKRMIPFADQIQLVHLKLQQVVSKMIPDGVFIDADGLNSVDLGNGASYNPSEALSMYFQTGSVIGRSYTEDGEFNNARVPIQELTSSGSNAKIASLINMYNYQLGMIRAVTGVNEARDGSAPDQYALVGIQKLAALNSNTATKHIVQSGLFITRKLCQALSYRLSDILQFSEFADDFAKMIGKNNLKILNDIRDLHLHDFGIFIELEPDEEEKALLEQNIQQSIQAQKIDLDDAIDIRQVNNLTLANTLLKIKKQRKEQEDMKKQQSTIQMQTQSNVQSAQAASQSRMQESQMKLQGESQLEQLKSKLELQKIQQEAEIQKQMLQLKYQFEFQLKQMDSENFQNKESFKEDRKDKRTEKQATQQSKMIAQRKENLPPTNFEEQEEEQVDPMANLLQNMNQKNML